MTDVREKIQFIRDMREALEAELQEAIDEVTWKPWSTKTPAINRAAYVGEMVDAWHFFMNMMLVEKITAEELFEGYQEKHLRNKARWAAEGGYKNDRKCVRCRRALDDVAAHQPEFSQYAFDVVGVGIVCLHCVTPGDEVKA